MHLILKELADHANNLAELAERKLKKNLSFSEDAQNELTTLSEKTKMIYEKALTALQGENKEVVNTVNQLEDEIDRLQKIFEANHIRRLKYKTCDPLIGIIFVDVLRNLEHVANHSNDIANATLLGF